MRSSVSTVVKNPMIVFCSHFQKEQPALVIQTTNTLNLPSKTAMQTRQHRRQSSLNAVSWPNPNELTVSPRLRRLSNSLAPAEVIPNYFFPESLFPINQSKLPLQDSVDVPSPRSPRSPRSVYRHQHRRKSSMGTSVAPDELTVDPSRRRSSFLTSLFVDDDTTRYDDMVGAGGGRKRSRGRSFWGPVGEAGLRDSIRSATSRSPVSHHECNYRNAKLDVITSVLFASTPFPSSHGGELLQFDLLLVLFLLLVNMPFPVSSF